jgi:hypothetical protein
MQHFEVDQEMCVHRSRNGGRKSAPSKLIRLANSQSDLSPYHSPTLALAARSVERESGSPFPAREGG